MRYRIGCDILHMAKDDLHENSLLLSMMYDCNEVESQNHYKVLKYMNIEQFILFNKMLCEVHNKL